MERQYFSPLSVDDLSKVQYYRLFDALEKIHEDIEYFAQAEQLTAHANSTLR